MSSVPARPQLEEELKSNVSGPCPWTPELFEEITDLMAEALFQDFQAHRERTV
jgi:hypothetical protein